MPASDQGLETGRYRLVPRTLTFIISHDSLLLLRGAPHKRRWANLYNGIGGHIDRGEDIFTSAKRELYEETGLSIDKLWLCGILQIDVEAESGVLVFIFRGETSQYELLPSGEGVPEWVPISDIARLPLVEDLPFLLPHILSAQPGSAPFIAQSRYDPDGVLQIRVLENRER